MKAVAKPEEEFDIMDDPRPRDRAMWNRLKLVLEAELCNQAWGCKLYQMHREGLISLDAMRAGDKYHQAFLDWRRWMATDPDEYIPEAREFIRGKIERARRKMREFTEVLGLLRNKYVEEIVIHETWPAYYHQKQRAIEALEDLGTFFARGTKRKRKSG